MLSFKPTLLALTIVSSLLAISTSAQAAGPIVSSTPAASIAGSSSSDINALVSALPICFQSCASKAATSTQLGCKSLTDLPCICSKPTFVTATTTCITSSNENECPALAKNTTAITQASKGLSEACAAYASTTNTSAATTASGDAQTRPHNTTSDSASTATKDSHSSALGMYVPSVLGLGIVVAVGMATVL